VSNLDHSTAVCRYLGFDPFDFAYRAKAVDMAARARADKTRAGKAEYARLSLGYLRLAEGADKKIKAKIPDETMPAITQQVRSRRLLHRLLAHVRTRRKATAKWRCRGETVPIRL
jgi:hypothetical protein